VKEKGKTDTMMSSGSLLYDPAFWETGRLSHLLRGVDNRTATDEVKYGALNQMKQNMRERRVPPQLLYTVQDYFVVQHPHHTATLELPKVFSCEGLYARFKIQQQEAFRSGGADGGSISFRMTLQDCQLRMADVLFAVLHIQMDHESGREPANVANIQITLPPEGVMWLDWLCTLLNANRRVNHALPPGVIPFRDLVAMLDVAANTVFPDQPAARAPHRTTSGSGLFGEDVWPRGAHGDGGGDEAGHEEAAVPADGGGETAAPPAPADGGGETAAPPGTVHTSF
jgi:hypothetical protein